MRSSLTLQSSECWTIPWRALCQMVLTPRPLQVCFMTITLFVGRWSFSERQSSSPREIPEEDGQQRSSGRHLLSRRSNCSLASAEAARTEDEPFNQRKSNPTYLFSFIEWIESMAERRTKTSSRKECPQCHRYKTQASTEALNLHSPPGVWSTTVQSVIGIRLGLLSKPPSRAQLLETTGCFLLWKSQRTSELEETEGPAPPDSFFPSKHFCDTMRKQEKMNALPAWSNSTELLWSWGSAMLSCLLLSHFPPQDIGWVVNEEQDAWKGRFWGRADRMKGGPLPSQVSVFEERSPLVLHHTGKMIQVKCDRF